MADMQALLSALDVFSRAPDKTSLESANAWLQDFQHSPEAWAACNVLLQNHEAPAAAKLFAAQTFRSKVTYDLHQVPTENLPSLRDTIVAALLAYHTGPKTIIVQLCLALAGLALQMPAWDNPVQTMVEAFGRNPATVPTLLQFLQTLPEELTSNTKIPITDDEYRERAALLMTNNAQKLLELLSMYYGATGVTVIVRQQIFNCLRSWLVAGEVGVSDLVQTPLFPGVFDALDNDELFDSAVDVICEIIHETQEIDDNMPVIEAIVPQVISLKPHLRKHHEDPDRIRGYARIFAEAGETYRVLLLQHTETFFPIVEAIGECSAYPDLEIVPITFQFWMRLAQIIGKKARVSPLFLDAYRALMLVIINHLHFPADLASMTGQELDSFRAFRHVMGDTLKDCCFVLRADTCLIATFTMIATALSKDPQNMTWQEVEAPLFALRSMGAEIDPSDNNAVPKIMDLIPSLPQHPRVRYAALLIIARYSEWTAEHPDSLQSQLQYVSAGFEDPDQEVRAAAGQALKYICQDCKSHLIEFLPTLHTFLGTTGTKLAQEDRQQVYEGIAHVISAMPVEAAAESLRTFALEILAQIHKATGQTALSKAETDEVTYALENLEVLLKFVGTFGEHLPKACENTCEQAWEIFDAFFVKFGNNPNIADQATQTVRRALEFFGDTALSVAPSVIARMSFSFEASGISSYLWIPGKIIARFGNDDDPSLRGSFKEFYERSTQKVVSLLQTKDPREMPDVLEDYIQSLIQLVQLAPDIFFESSSFSYAFRASLGSLQVVYSDVIFAGLILFGNILDHESMDGARKGSHPPKFALYAAAIRQTVEKEGFGLLGCLLTGLTGDFPEDSIANVVSIWRALARDWPTQLITWLPSVLEQMPIALVTADAKRQFLADVQNAISNAQYDKVKYAILAFTRASRKTRERRRNGL